MGGRGSWSSTGFGLLASAPGNSRKVQRGHSDGLMIGPDAPYSTAGDIADYLGMDNASAAYADYTSVVSFTGTAYSDIRRNARTGIKDARVDECEEFIKNAPQWKGGTTYRGIELDPKTVSKLKPGATIDVNGGGPASWSTDSSIADTFAGNIGGASVVFISKKQKKATSIKGISKYSHENEVLVSRNTQYRVLSVSQGHSSTNNRLYVEVDVL